LSIIFGKISQIVIYYDFEGDQPKTHDIELIVQQLERKLPEPVSQKIYDFLGIISECYIS
jgi:hypothetical protein